MPRTSFKSILNKQDKNGEKLTIKHSNMFLKRPDTII